MATDKKKTDARDALDASTSSNEKGELNAITVKSLTNIEEKIESIDWKLWEIYNIVKYRCGVCHATNPTFEGFENPPAGLVFDTTQNILENIDNIKAQSIDSDIMPPGNLTGMTENERKKIAEWIKVGTPINN